MRHYHFTERVRLSLAAARDEADRLGFEYVGTEHLLLGVLSVDDALRPDLLAAGGLTAAALRGDLERQLGHGKVAPGTSADLPYTSRAKRVLELAMDEAATARADAVDAEHLLIAMLVEDGGLAGKMLRSQGLEASRVRRAVESSADGTRRTTRSTLRRLWKWMSGRFRGMNPDA